MVIGDDVWLGGGVIVCPGVSIGAGTTIAAGSVVTRDVPPRVLAAGNPCRVLRADRRRGLTPLERRYSFGVIVQIACGSSRRRTMLSDRYSS